MPRCTMRSALLLAIACTVGFTKTPEQLKSEFAGILPAGKKVRMAWCKGGYWQNGYTGNERKSVYVVDSDDGVIRELTPDSLFPGVASDCGSFPSITADGSRVIFRENNTRMVYVINWDGSGLKEVLPVSFMSRYWRNPVDNSDWVTVDNYGIYRYNIDQPTSRVLLWNRTDIIWSFFTLSPDGARLGFMPGGQSENFLIAGCGIVPNGAFIQADTGGCRVNMAHDNSYDFLFQLPYHRIVRICDSLGRKREDIIVTDTILSWASRNSLYNNCSKSSQPQQYRQFDELRWTNDRNFITFHMYCTVVNPYLYRLSDHAFVSIMDSLGECDYVGNSDAVFLDTGATPPAPPQIRPVADYICLLSAASERTVFTTGTPAPTLSAAGLPPGLLVVNGTTPSNAFVISGQPSQLGSFPVTLTAENSEGADSKSLTITVTDTNSPPVAHAGADTTIRLGLRFYLSGSVTDDGIPNLQSTSAWELDTNFARGATIGVKSASNTLVTFSDTGLYSFILFANDGQLSDTDTVMVSVRMAIPNLVIKPSANDTIFGGTTDTICWQIDPPTSVLVLLSVNGGMSFDYDLTTGAAVPPGTTSLSWDVPTDIPNSNDCRIQIVDYIPHQQLAISGRLTFAGGAGVAPGNLGRKRGTDLLKYEVYSLDGRRLDARILTSRPGAQARGIVVLRPPGARAGVTRITLVPR